jgi:hypothetical protein
MKDSAMPLIPPSFIGTVSPILADAFTHSRLNDLFMAAGFPGDVPEGNKSDKVRSWLRRANKGCDEPLTMFGRVIAEFMDSELHPGYIESQGGDPRDKIRAVLAKEGLSYQRGGFILGTGLTGPSKSLAERLKSGGIQAIEIEYQRAYEAIEKDPAAAVTAACAILESVCKTYLEEEGHELPGKQVLGSLWSEVAGHLGLTPKVVADDDLKRILQGLYSIADGVGALRTHAGSAHGHSTGRSYKLASRHARLAVHAAHTMAMFVLETWEARKKGA